jgi:hypothetical protein
VDKGRFLIERHLTDGTPIAELAEAIAATLATQWLELFAPPRAKDRVHCRTINLASERATHWSRAPRSIISAGPHDGSQ